MNGLIPLVIAEGEATAVVIYSCEINRDTIANGISPIGLVSGPVVKCLTMMPDH